MMDGQPHTPSGEWPHTPTGQWPPVPTRQWPPVPTGQWPPVPTGQWPPEVPPLHPPMPPAEPEPPTPGPLPSRPSRMLPTWEESDPRALEGDLADQLLEHRIIVVGGSLNDALADRAAAQLLLLGRRSHQPIEMHLTCPGSELSAALSLADAVDLVSAPVNAVVRGILKGPAVAVLCAARHRVAHRNALLVLSLPSVSAEGTGQMLAAAAEQHERQVAQLRARLVSATGRGDEQVGADLEAGKLFTAEEALAYGLVQEVR
jgi:ATP-dependent Clp protease protease subunit